MASTAPFDIGSLIESTPGVYGGEPCLAGTRFPVLQVAAEYAGGLSAEEIAESYPDLDLVKVHAGIAYYLANRDSIDRQLQERTAAHLAAARSTGHGNQTGA